MIPRVKVNYSFFDLIRSVFITDNCNKYRQDLVTTLGSFFNIDNVLLTPSGRSGLYYILKAIDRPKVLIPAYTCKAVAEAAVLAGKEVIYVEVSEDGFNMSPAALEKHLAEDTVVIATHQFGFPCDINLIVELSKKKNAMVVEDAAASFGSRVNGQLTGTFGDAAFFSFDSTKLISVPLKGGFLTAKDGLFERIRHCYSSEIKTMPQLHKVKLLTMGFVLVTIEKPFLYRIFHTLRFGLTRTFTAETATLAKHPDEYYQYNLTEWQACIALSQIKKIEHIIQKRQDLFAALRRRLLHNNDFLLPPEDTEQEWACIRFPIRIRGDKMTYYRKAVRRGIDFAFSFTFISSPESFKYSHRLADSVLDLPYYLKLKDKEIVYIANTLSDIAQERHDER